MPPERTCANYLTKFSSCQGIIVAMDDGREGDGGNWTLLTGHGHVLVEIARSPRARIRDIAAAAGITERTAQAIIADLEAAGYLTRARSGRRTVYTVYPDRPFRHAAQKGHRVGPVLTLLASPGGAAAPGAERDRIRG
jgi:MarR family protein